MKKQIIITGGAGFIGIRLTKKPLAANGLLYEILLARLTPG
ncbi:MAG: hypothetical protein U9M94_02565 [Patescibacteria group bacterium]|nr:hypothetical protein [Patescibacteria group bacterium]